MSELLLATKLQAPQERRLPISARSLGVRMEDGRPNSDDLIRLAEEWLLVRVGLD